MLPVVFWLIFFRAPFSAASSSDGVKHNEQRAQAQPGRRLGAGPLSHLASASRSLTDGSAPSTHVSPNSGSYSRLAASGDCEEGSPPPHARLHSSSAQQFGDTARLGAREQAHEGHPVREPPATDLEAEDKQAAAPAPEELRVSVVALAASNLAQGSAVHGQPPAAERRQLGRG